MTYLCIILGALFLLMAISATPAIILGIGEVDTAYLLGKSTVVLGEYLLGGYLLRAGIRLARSGGY